MIRRPPRSTLSSSSAASDVYKRQVERECAVIRSRPTVNGSPAGDRQGVPAQRSLTVRLDGFAWEALEQESARLGVPVEELITFSVLYYLADICLLYTSDAAD